MGILTTEQIAKLDVERAEGGALRSSTAALAPFGLSPASGSSAKLPAANAYRGWDITWDYGYFTATSPNYDASYEGPEDGWVDNGQRVSARTREDLFIEVDAWIEEHADGQH